MRHWLLVAGAEAPYRRPAASDRQPAASLDLTSEPAYNSRLFDEGSWFRDMGGKLGSSKALTRRTFPATILGSRLTSAAVAVYRQRARRSINCSLTSDVSECGVRTLWFGGRRGPRTGLKL